MSQEKSPYSSSELFIWISTQIVIVFIAVALWCCHLKERRKFKKQLYDFRDTRDFNNNREFIDVNRNQVQPLLGSQNRDLHDKQ